MWSGPRRRLTSSTFITSGIPGQHPFGFQKLPQDFERQELVGSAIVVQPTFPLGQPNKFALVDAGMTDCIAEGEEFEPPCLEFLSTCGSVFRLSITYSMGITVCVVASCALAVSIQLFFSLFISLVYPDEAWGSLPRNPAYVWGAFVLTPFGFWLSAVLVDQMFEVVLDGMHHPPLLKFRSMLLILGLPYVWTDAIFIGIQIVSPIVATFLTFFSEAAQGRGLNWWYFLKDVHRGFCNGALVACILLGLVYCVVHMIHLACIPQERLWITMEHLELRELGECCCRPVLSAPLTVEEAARNARHGRREAAIRMTCSTGPPNLLGGLAYMLTALLALIFIGALAKFQLLSFAILLAAVLVCLALITYGAHRILPGLVGCIYYFMIVLFVVVTLGLQGFNTNTMEASDTESAPLAKDTFVHLFDHPGAIQPTWSYPNSSSAYPVCHQHWGSPTEPGKQRLSVQDLAVFADAIYSEEEIAKLQIREAFENTHLGAPKFEFMKPEYVVGKWASWVFHDSKVRVLAVRGTHTATEALVDAEVYATIEIMSILDFFVPVLSLLHQRTTRALVHAFSTSSDYFHGGHIWDQLLEEATRLKSKSDADGFDLVVTGHSLGGILGIITGAMTMSKSVVFSPPGSLFTIWRFDIQGKNIRSTSTVIQPQRDPVPEVDEQMGMVQFIDCKHEPLKCHSIRRTRCTLYQVCGDPRGRKMDSVCEGMFLEDLPPSWLHF